MINSRTICTALAALWLAQCAGGPADHAGSATEVEVAFSGAVIDKDGLAAAGVPVRLRHARYLPGDEGLAKPAMDTVTDAAGRFAFGGFAPDSFVIEAMAGDTSAALLEAVFTEPGRFGDTLRLERTGRIQGWLARPDTEAFVQVYGLERTARADHAGFFSVVVPAGVFTPRIGRIGGDAADLPSVTVVPGAAVSLDTVVVPDLRKALEAYWRFDEPSGDTIRDASGNSHHGIRYSAQRTDGRSGGGLRFADSADCAVVPHAADSSLDFGADADFTLAAWIRLDATTTNDSAVNHRIVSKQRLNGNSYTLRIMGNGRPAVGVRSQDAGPIVSGEPQFNLEGPDTVNDGSWHHLAGVRRGALLQIFVDGRLVASMAATALSVHSQADLYLGALRPGDGTFGGDIDEVRIYRRALGALEIGLLAR